MKLHNLKKCGLALLVAAMLLTATACNSTSASSASQSESSSQPMAEPAASQAPTSITDREGNTLVLPQKLERIISVAPSITETLVHLGLGERIVAVDRYSVGIPGIAEDLPTFDMMSPDTESLVALQPDIIFATGMSKSGGDDPLKPITDLGIVITYVPSSVRIQGIKEDIRFIGEVTANQPRADEIVQQLEQEIADILAKVPTGGTPKKVYFEIAAAPSAYSFGKGTFLNEIIELLGAQNVLAEQDGWLSVSEETIIAKNPDIIFTNIDYTDDPVSEILGRNGWNSINAVKQKQVFWIAKNASSRPNENISIAIAEMAKALYPDKFQS